LASRWLTRRNGKLRSVRFDFRFIATHLGNVLRGHSGCLWERGLPACWSRQLAETSVAMGSLRENVAVAGKLPATAG
jgi:hypothetical protein